MVSMVKNMLPSDCSFSDKFEQSLLKKQPRSLANAEVASFIFETCHTNFSFYIYNQKSL